MAKLIVELEWNDELGEAWMNLENLKACLYGQTYTKPELLSVEPVERTDEEKFWALW